MNLSFFKMGVIAKRKNLVLSTHDPRVRVVNEANSVVPALGNGPLHLPKTGCGMIWNDMDS